MQRADADDDRAGVPQPVLNIEHDRGKAFAPDDLRHDG